MNVAAMTSSESLFGWTVLSVLDEAVTVQVQEYSLISIMSRLVEPGSSCNRSFYTLVGSRIGRSKDALDYINNYCI